LVPAPSAKFAHHGYSIAPAGVPDPAAKAKPKANPASKNGNSLITAPCPSVPLNQCRTVPVIPRQVTPHARMGSR
jgi:hypothetical protein